MTTAITPPSPSGRLRALDGLRGLAALTVVFTHLNGIASAKTYPDYNKISDVGGWLSWAGQSAVLASGTQAVFVFFLLSGIVITLPVLKHRDYDWFAYYPRRLVRLYVPAMSSLLLSALLVLLIHRDVSNVEAGGWFSSTNIANFSLRKLLSELTLFDGSYLYNGPLWSIVWEVLFSGLLPLFVVIAVLVRRWWVLGIVACFVINAYSVYQGLATPGTLSMFLIGSIIATRIDRIRELGARLHTRSSSWLTTAGLLTIAALLLLTRVLLPPAISGIPWVLVITNSGWLLACLIIVFLALTSPASITVLSTRVVQWLGKISFSLYLVHIPVLATLAFALGDDHWVRICAIGLPLSIVVAYLFYLTVERPSHRLSYRAGALGAAGRDRWLASSGQPDATQTRPTSTGADR